MKKIYIIMLFFTIAGYSQATQEEFVDSVNELANVIVAHDHRIGDADLVTSGNLGYTKTIQLATDIIDWKDGARVTLGSQANFITVFGSSSNIHNFYELAVARLQDFNLKDGNGEVNIIRNSFELVKPTDSVPNIILAFEGVSAFANTIANFDPFYNSGLRQVQLWRDDAMNDAVAENGDLTAFGIDLIEKCNQKGVAIDVSHIARDKGLSTITDIIAESEDPVMISHQPMTGVSMTVEYDAMEAVAADGGIVCVQFFGPFVNLHTVAGLAASIRTLVDLLGIDHVGLGGDYFPENNQYWVPATLSDLNDLTEALYNEDFTAEEVVKIYGGNLKDFYAIVWHDACVPSEISYTVANATGISISGSTITKTAATGWANSGGSSSVALAPNDHLTYTVDAAKNVMVGLSETDADADYHSIDFALYARTDNYIYIYEDGVPVASQIATYNAASTLGIIADTDTVRYLLDGDVIYSSDRPNSNPLYADFSLYTSGAHIYNLQLFDGCCPDADWDGVCDADDICEGHDDNIDTDSDGIPDGCDNFCEPTLLTYSLTNTAGLSVTGSDITKSAATGWGNGGGSSNIALSNDDYFTFKGKTGKAAMVGLSVSDSNQHYNTIGYALYARHDNNLYVYEGGTQIGTSLGTFTDSSVLKVEIKDDKVNYYKDGVALTYQSSLPNSTTPMYVDFALYQQDAKISDLKLYDGCCDCAPCVPELTTYTINDQAGISISGSTITKNTATGWTSGGAGSVTLTEGDYITYEVLAGYSVMVGLSATNADAHYNTIDYGLYNRFDNTLSVYENGTQVASGLGTFNGSSLMKIAIEGGEVHFYHNATDLGYHPALPSGPPSQIVDFALYTNGAQIKNLKIYTCQEEAKNTPSSTAAEKATIKATKLTLYPNPVQQQFRANISGQYMIYNMTGQLVLKTIVNNPSEYVDVRSLPVGIYQVVVMDNGQRLVARLIKE